MRKFFLMALAIVLFIAACTKIESTGIGTGLIPPADGVNTFDTLIDVYTNNFLDSTGLTAKVYKSDDHVIGVINNDPVFGTTIASAYMELKPTYYKYAFPADTSLIPDSAVLILSYKGVYGDSSIPQMWEVYELTDSLRSDTTYDIRQSFGTGALLASQVINIGRLADSVKYGMENAKNQIRIKLDTALATRLMKTYPAASTISGPYTNDTLFRNAFKGFAIMPAAGSPGNALIRINLLDTNTKLALFYSYRANDTGAVRTSTVNYFRFSTGTITNVSGSANHIVRSRAGSEAMANFNGAANSANVYVQTNPGTFATVRIPTLPDFPNSIIHRAELIAVQDPEPSMLYQNLSAPPFLLLSHYDTASKIKRNVPNDFIVSSGIDNFSSFGGYSIDRSISGSIVKSYLFDISRYVQGIVTRRDTSFTLQLSAPTHDSLLFTSPYPTSVAGGKYYLSPTITNNTAQGRVKLGGGAKAYADPVRMRLRIIYSKI